MDVGNGAAGVGKTGWRTEGRSTGSSKIFLKVFGVRVTNMADVDYGFWRGFSTRQKGTGGHLVVDRK